MLKNSFKFVLKITKSPEVPARFQFERASWIELILKNSAYHISILSNNLL